MRVQAGVAFAVWVALAGAPNAAAATFTVTRADDPAPGACDSDCSLREAVLAANAVTGGDTIVLPAGHYRLTIPGAGEDAAATGDLDLTRAVTIAGSGARSTVIDAEGGDRVFDVAAGTTVQISDVSITGGLVAGDGAGIRSAGVLGLDRVVIAGNDALGLGGGVFSGGPSASVARSTVSGNSASLGGGISFANALAVSNATIAGNVAGGPGSAMGRGGGLSGSTGSTLLLTSATVTDNQSFEGPGSGGGIDAPSAMLQNTIVAANLAHTSDQSGSTLDNCATAAMSQGHNLSDTADCGLTQAGDQQGAAVLLGPLTGNGGPTDTEAVLAGSLALDAGAGCPETDQRGVSRPRGAACDIGAYERAAPLAATTAATNIAFSSTTLNGTVDPSFRETTAHFEFGRTTAYGSSTPTQIVGSGNGQLAFAAMLTGLRQGVTYHFRLVATNAEGTTAGADQSFTTLDKTAPALTLLRVDPGLFHRATGATIRFTLSEPATVAFRVDHVLRGVRVRGRCVRRTRRNRRHRPCTRYLAVPGTFVQNGIEGANSFHFDAKVNGKRLTLGAYRLRAKAVDAAGIAGKTVMAPFRVLR